jgi:guanylate kinase
MNNLIILVGESCAGKDSIASILKERLGLNFIVSTTSRPIRPNESEGNPYHFVTYNQFKDMIANDEFIEYRTYYTKLSDGSDDIWFYGIHKNDIDLNNHIYVGVVDLQGLKDLKKYYNDNIISFYIDVDEETRKQRCIKRGDYNEYEWTRRAIDNAEKFAYSIVSSEVDYIVPNYDLQDCVDSIVTMIGRCK